MKKLIALISLAVILIEVWANAPCVHREFIFDD